MFLALLVLLFAGSALVARHDASPDYPWPRSPVGSCLVLAGAVLGALLGVTTAVSAILALETGLWTLLLALTVTALVPPVGYLLMWQVFHRLYLRANVICLR